ncbi:MAG: hypothetical protein RLZZ543_130 [Bacteroidota bacterium]|jgi:hypothetical protein
MRLSRLLSAFSLVLISSFSQAQSYQLEDKVSYDFGSVEEDLASHVSIRNVSGSTKRVLVKSEVINLVSGHTTFFCWEQCYDNSVTVSPTYIEVLDGDSIDKFHGYVRPNGVPGISTIRYTFYSVNAPADSIQMISTFEASPVGMKDVKSSTSSIVAFPNPANDKITLKYTLNSATAKIEIFNLLGTKVVAMPVYQSEGSISISTDELSSGLYFYTLSEEGKTSKPQRLTIKH